MLCVVRLNYKPDVAGIKICKEYCRNNQPISYTKGHTPKVITISASVRSASEI